jgi:copper chaperone
MPENQPARYDVRVRSFEYLKEQGMYTFKVDDMTCSGCAASVRKSVSRLPGVTAVTADPETKDVVVEASADVTREAVIAAINTAGYREITLVEATS